MASAWAPVRTTTGTNPSKFTLLPKTSQQGTLACSRNPASVSAGEQVACQEKTLTNMRSSTANAARRLNANMKFSLRGSHGNSSLTTNWWRSPHKTYGSARWNSRRWTENANTASGHEPETKDASRQKSQLQSPLERPPRGPLTILSLES